LAARFLAALFRPAFFLAMLPPRSG
jgi:hypothetical protein